MFPGCWTRCVPRDWCSYDDKLQAKLLIIAQFGPIGYNLLTLQQLGSYCKSSAFVTVVTTELDQHFGFAGIKLVWFSRTAEHVRRTGKVLILLNKTHGHCFNSLRLNKLLL